MDFETRLKIMKKDELLNRFFSPAPKNMINLFAVNSILPVFIIVVLAYIFYPNILLISIFILLALVIQRVTYLEIKKFYLKKNSIIEKNNLLVDEVFESLKTKKTLEKEYILLSVINSVNFDRVNLYNLREINHENFVKFLKNIFTEANESLDCTRGHYSLCRHKFPELIEKEASK